MQQARWARRAGAGLANMPAVRATKECAPRPPAYPDGVMGRGLSVQHLHSTHLSCLQRQCKLPGPRRVATVCGAAGALSLNSGDSRPQQQQQQQQNPYDGEIWSVALPALATMLLEPTLSVINAGMVGQLGTQQLSAASVGIMVCNFTTFLFSFLLFLTTPEVAAAIVKNDRAEVSRISAKSLWVAGFFGTITTAALFLAAPSIIAVMAPPEPEVVRYAVEYVSIRAWGVLPVLCGFVATGMFRGFKDTRTPLFAAVGAACSSLGLSYLFIHVLKLGVKGSAMAVTISQTVSASGLCGLMLYKGMMRLPDLLRPPSVESVLPMLRKGLVLGLRNIISFGMVLYGSTLCVRAGSTYQAAFEIIRQVWLLTIQFFECLNVATQALCAAYLGAGDRASAGAALQRLLQLGVLIGGAAGLAVFGLQMQITGFFTKDVAVVAQVLATLPVVCLMFPLDAAASIMDGSLLAAKQSDYMSVVQIAGSMAQLALLLALTRHELVSCLSIWAVLKVMTLVRVAGGAVRNLSPTRSAYRVHAPSSHKHAAANSTPPAAAAASMAANAAALGAASSTQTQRTLNGAGGDGGTRHASGHVEEATSSSSSGAGVVGTVSFSSGPSSPGASNGAASQASTSEAQGLVHSTESPQQGGSAGSTHSGTRADSMGGSQQPEFVPMPTGALPILLSSVDADLYDTEAEAMCQDYLAADLVPAHVCAMQAAAERGNADWHAAHDALGRCKSAQVEGGSTEEKGGKGGNGRGAEVPQVVRTPAA